MITFLRVAVGTAALALFGSMIPNVLQGIDLKIKTVQRNSGTPVAMNPRFEERIVYLQGNRRRTEERREQRNPLWPGGPRVTFYEHNALIENCDGDRRKAFGLNLDSRTFAPIEMSRRLTPEEIKAFQARIPPEVERPTLPTVLHETTTRDTGERKRVFGYTARHVITIFKVVPLAGSTDVVDMQTVSDGWYIDLDTRISCDPPRKVLAEGTTYAAVVLLGGVTSDQTTGPISASNPSLVQTKYIGEPETGFPIWLKTTIRNSAPTRTGNSEQVSVTETEVTELSTNPLDAYLFEVPTNFRSVPLTKALLTLRVAWWARWLAWGHYYWVRLRKAI